MENWTEVAKKRKANSPMESREKEPRGDRDIDVELEDLKNKETRRGSVASRDSFSSIASTMTQRTNKPARESVFQTKKPEGAFRDEIVVELLTLDDQPFRGTVTIKEAVSSIFVEKLGFQKTDLQSLVIGYSGGPIVTYKLSMQFNIDTLKAIQHFEMERRMMVRNEERISIVKCKIRGIRTEWDEQEEGYVDSGLRWVKVEGCEFRIDKEQIIEWLSYFGEVKSDVTEDTVEDPDSEDDIRYGNGIYSVRMKIRRDLPQFMPMFGKRVRLYYRGIVKRCTNCFDPHRRKLCKNEKVQWSEYVRGFAENFPEIPRALYGKWEKMLDGQPQSSTRRVVENEGEKKTEEENENVQAQKLSVPSTPQSSNTSSNENVQTQIQTSSADQARIEEEVGEENEEEETDDDDELFNLVKNMRASGISKTSIKQTLSAGFKRDQKGGKGKGKGRGRGRGKN